MKRISLVWVLAACCAVPMSRGQDAATEERLNQLNGKIEQLIESQQALSKQIERLSKEIDGVREQASRPTGNYASQERCDALAKAVAEVDKKRLQDAEKVKTELEAIRKAIISAPAPTTGKKKPASQATDTPGSDKEQGFEYTVKSGDTLSTIAQAYRDQKIKVSVDQILKANPGLKADRLIVGKTIFIPAPKQ